MRPESSSRIAPNWPWIGKMTIISQFADMTSSSNFFGVDFFDSSSLVTGPSFMSILPLVLELCYKGLTRSLEIGNTPEFCPISGDWSDLGIPILVRMSLMKYYQMLQNAMVTICTSKIWKSLYEDKKQNLIKYRKKY